MYETTLKDAGIGERNIPGGNGRKGSPHKEKEREEERKSNPHPTKGGAGCFWDYF